MTGTGVAPQTSIRNRKSKIYVTFSAAIFAFLAYSSIFAFRKPFTAGNFTDQLYFGITYKTLLIISQVVGYMLSKFAGIKFIAELKSRGRFRATVILVMIAWFALLIFAVIPAPYGMVCLFVNGFALGFLWGIVFSYVEGRQSTDLIGSVLAVSFIFAGGFTRSVATWLMVRFGVSEMWMPFMTGLVFVLPFFIMLYRLDKVPPPDEQDIIERGVREPLDGPGRKALLRRFGPGIVVIAITYLFLTIMRDIRDNYMTNIWTELGYGKNYSILATTETITSVIVLVIMAMLVIIRKNIRAFMLIHAVIFAGFGIVIVSTLLFNNGRMSGALWMQLVSLGLYLGYIPFNSIFFERMIASFRITGNVGFLIYLADSFGYFGSVGVMLSKELTTINVSWSKFFANGVVYLSFLGLIGMAFSYAYFLKKYRNSKLVQ